MKTNSTPPAAPPPHPLAVLLQQFAQIVERVERVRDQPAAPGREIDRLCEGLMQRAFAWELVA